MNETYLQSLKDGDRFYGLYIGEVINSKDDPLKSGRVQVKIAGFNDESDSVDQYPWVRVATDPFGGDTNRRGKKTIPLEGSFVYVMFLQGDPDYPVIIGGVPFDEQGSAEFKGNQQKHDINKTREDTLLDHEVSPVIGEYPYIYPIEGVHYSVIYDDTPEQPQLKFMISNGSHLDIRYDMVQLASKNDMNILAKNTITQYSTDWKTYVDNDWIMDVSHNVEWNVTRQIRIDAGFNISINVGGTLVNINTGGLVNIDGEVRVNGIVYATDLITAAGISLQNHIHGGVKTGGGNTGTPQ